MFGFFKRTPVKEGLQEEVATTPTEPKRDQFSEVFDEHHLQAILRAHFRAGSSETILRAANCPFQCE